MTKVFAKFWILLSALAFLAGCASTQPPAETHDGLVLQSSKKVDEFYLRPGVTLGDYSEFGLASCEVAFKKNWMHDQNQNRVDLTNRVTQQDVDKIKDSLGEQCDKHFREALEQAPAYKLVEQFDNGESVLVLRPSIINLDINAPDTNSANMNRSYTTSSGEMTLFLELVDGTTGEILARVVDRRKGMDAGRLQWTNSVTNKADSDRALKRWAQQLREALDGALDK